MSLFTGIARGVLREYSLRVYSNDLDGRVTFIKVGISDHDSMNRNLPSMATVRGERNVLLFFFSFVPLLTMVFRFGSAIPYKPEYISTLQQHGRPSLAGKATSTLPNLQRHQHRQLYPLLPVETATLEYYRRAFHKGIRANHD